MIDPTTLEVQKLSELPELLNIKQDDLLLITHSGESFKVTKSQLFADVKEKTFIHDQMIPSAVWTINHNLNQYPSVSIVDSTGRLVIGDVTYLDENILTLEFSAGFAGKAFLN